MIIGCCVAVSAALGVRIHLVSIKTVVNVWLVMTSDRAINKASHLISLILA